MKNATQTTKPVTDDAALFARVKNAKGVTLSAGTAAAVVASGAKTAPVLNPIERPLSKKAQRKLDVEARRIAKAAAKELIETGTLKATVTPAPALAVVGETVEPIEKVKRSIVPMKFKERYKGHGGTCGDDMALELKAATTTRNADKREVLDVEALWAIAKANAIDVSKYVDLNNGQKRMNVGNKLRGKLAAGADVVIGARQFKAEDFVPKH